MRSTPSSHYVTVSNIKDRLISAGSSFVPIVFLANSLLLSGQSWAATHYVDPAAASAPPGTGCGSSAGYTTIQAAVTAASPGDTIRVCAGTYPELAAGPLTISKTLTLLGAQNGVDARSRVGAESIVTDLQHNLIQNNNQPGGASGTGIYTDEFVAGGAVSNNAKCNWWNSSTGSTGPLNPNNPGGTGEEVVGDADFTPWLTARAPGGPCVGGIPSTPGKVTGGGQIPGTDPIFSPLGNLITLPALMLNPGNSNAKATFGFVVRCCPATGNLEYNDHQTGVRIKANSIDALIISNGSCGPNTHATFTGTASVIRSIGTTTEPFTVEVDDCGEPGTVDTFRIETTTYSNGPSTRIGGNIQIHR